MREVQLRLILTVRQGIHSQAVNLGVFQQVQVIVCKQDYDDVSADRSDIRRILFYYFLVE